MKQSSAGIGESFKMRRISALLQAAILAFAALTPFLLTGVSSAAPVLSARSAVINKSTIHNGTTFINNDVEFAFSYTLSDTTATKAGIMYQFCTTPLGTCILPSSMDVQTSNSHDSQASWPTNGTAFAPVSEAADVGDCTLNTNSYINCYSRDETVATGVTGGAVTHTISGIEAPDTIQSVYVRIYIYSDNDFGSGDLIQEGVVAVAFVDQLTINGRVQERLNFCVAAVDDDDVLGTVSPDVSTCSAISDSNIDLGVIDNTSIARAPVEPTATNGADDDYGILMLNTNASGGAVVAYYPEAQASVSGGDTDQLRSFRVAPTNCDASGASVVDQCFVSAINSASGSTFAVGTETFGLAIPCIDTTQGTTTNLGSVPAWYDADGTTTSSADCESTDASVIYGWNATGTADTLATSASVVDDEIIKLRFGAAAASTTPTGSYTVVTTYIATPTF